MYDFRVEWPWATGSGLTSTHFGQGWRWWAVWVVHAAVFRIYYVRRYAPPDDGIVVDGQELGMVASVCIFRQATSSAKRYRGQVLHPTFCPHPPHVADARSRLRKKFGFLPGDH
jgi:hypothetical protein